ncbi:hypothetical protein BO86DRAFT_302596 [Aspergillus japonicus CBS 114.51]|uniref:Uncharacterized protein n=2 Tax=Aspergillus TaxID=5052 RepID=A0A2V5GVT2_ASPV1|nr:hypothetical protein BO86DRAFT_302596 [Aspergillus japonicus CBS 114.51]PYI13202.1 hypothetical protein BO99DRAFT_372810 [Aspergillus violaceofuscus CBS 115571]RAH86525.1 hypothetical protein BO86DRAFT_302596 [Aspergillus japonicus CBS 114.51]
MSNERSTDPISVPSSSAHRRRASLASGLTFTDYLSRSGSQGHSTGAPTGSMASSVGNAPPNQGRRLSITTLGLAGSPNQTSPWGSKSMRHGSISSSVGSGSANLEDAVVEDSESGGPSSAAPHSPFARRLSFGAQALRDARAGSISNGRYPSPGISVSSRRRLPPTCSKSFHSPTESTVASEGFNWSEALRTRAERAPSLGITSPTTPQTQPLTGSGQQYHHQRATSIASMEQPAREIPKQPKQNKPDFFQEKILRGDFMD